MEQFSILDTKFGEFGILLIKNHLKRVFLPNKLGSINLNVTHPNDHSLLMQKIIDQLNRYFLGELVNFDVKYEPQNSSFYKKVLHEVCKTPYGETTSYKYIAQKLRNPLAYRAVANANATNLIPIIIPCHRVILSNGSLGDYGGGKNLKRNLINLEKNNLKKN